MKKKRELQNRRQEAYERRSKLRAQSEDSTSDKSDVRYEMAGGKSREKKNKSRQQKATESSVRNKGTKFELQSFAINKNGKIFA